MLAAANPIYGRYDDLKSAAENIDLMTTILSRFDLIFIVRDIRYDAVPHFVRYHTLTFKTLSVIVCLSYCRQT